MSHDFFLLHNYHYPISPPNFVIGKVMNTSGIYTIEHLPNCKSKTPHPMSLYSKKQKSPNVIGSTTFLLKNNISL